MTGHPVADNSQMRRGYVYLLANKRNGTLYVGVTSNLSKRVYEHKKGLASSFTTRYGVTMLVWYEDYPSVQDAIHRDSSLKRWNRKWKLALTEKINPDWKDISAGLV